MRGGGLPAGAHELCSLSTGAASAPPGLQTFASATGKPAQPSPTNM